MSVDAIPTDLGPNDEGFLLRVPDYNHLLFWTGTVWEFAPGDGGNGYIGEFALPPGAGWALCDGTETTLLRVGARVDAVRVMTPNETGGVYHKSARAFDPAVKPATGGAVTGQTADEGAHTHPITLPAGVDSAPTTAAAAVVASGAGASVASATHTHRTTQWVIATDAGAAHRHGSGSLTAGGGEPVHVEVMRYLRR